MTRADEIRELYAYNRWANARILEVAATLDDEALGRDLGSSYPSVLATLGHIAAADWVWLRRWQGDSPAGLPVDWNQTALAAVREKWDEVESERTRFLAGLDDAALERVVTYHDIAGRPWSNRMDQMLRHVVNHSTYHRGQIVTMLRQLGGTPPATDLIAYHRERNAAGHQPTGPVAAGRN